MQTLSLRNRAWLLLLVRLANDAGLDPLPKWMLHSLVFLANCLAPVYGETPLESRVVKNPRGPFYPDAQWDIDRLVAQGALVIIDLEYTQSEYGTWLEATYQISTTGKSFVSRSLSSPFFRDSHKYLLELTSAFASINKMRVDAAVRSDSIYRTPGVANWSPLIFEREKDNFSVATADAFSRLMPHGTVLSPKERIVLYVKYLDFLAQREQNVLESKI